MITELTARIEEWARERALDTANPDKQMLFQSTHSCRVRLLILCDFHQISSLHKRNSEDI